MPRILQFKNSTEARFGVRGTLNVELAATGALVGTIDFTLASPDKTLPEIAEAEALLGHSLVFAGDEVLWAWGFTLVGTNRYTAQLLRARYSTTRGNHGVGDSVVPFFPTDDRRLVVHKLPFKEVTQRFKVQPWLFQLSRDGPRGVGCCHSLPASPGRCPARPAEPSAQSPRRAVTPGRGGNRGTELARAI